MLRKNIEHHINFECINIEITCKGNIFACNFKDNLLNLTEHETKMSLCYIISCFTKIT
jgi:hypothetical protein